VIELLERLDGRSSNNAQSFNTRHVPSIGTTAIKLTDSVGLVSVINTGTTTLTIGSEQSTLVSGLGLPLNAGTVAGDGKGDLLEFNTSGPMYVISSGAGGSCTVIKE